MVDTSKITTAREPQRHEHRPGMPQQKREQTGGGLVESLKDKAQDVAGNVSQMAGQVKETAEEWTSAAADAAVQAKDRAMEFASTAADQVGDIGQDAARLIRRYPLQALCAGFALGFLLGQLGNRR